jgi:hypothetical protein
MHLLVDAEEVPFLFRKAFVSAVDAFLMEEMGKERNVVGVDRRLFFVCRYRRMEDTKFENVEDF